MIDGNWELDVVCSPSMKRTIIALLAVSAFAQSKVDFEMMTWVEVKKAMEGGKTTALIYNGGTEQRGPQNVNGGHTLMGREIVRAIALPRASLGLCVAAQKTPLSFRHTLSPSLANCSNAGSLKRRENSSAQQTSRLPSSSVRMT